MESTRNSKAVKAKLGIYVTQFQTEYLDDLLSEHICGKENYMNDLEALPAKTYRYATFLIVLIQLYLSVNF